MREAMERSVTVNAKRDSTDPRGQFGISSIAESHDYGGDFGVARRPTGLVSKGADQGPCLYLGPRGQRCGRRALRGGFCAIHQSGGASGGASKPSKKFVASLLAIAAVIWPYLADIVREVIRWIHTH